MREEIVGRLKRLRIPLAWYFLGLIFLSWIIAVLNFIVGWIEGRKIPVIVADISGFALNLPFAALLVFMIFLCAFIEPLPAGLKKLISLSAWTLLAGTIATFLFAVFVIVNQNRGVAIALEIVGTLTDLFFKAVLTLLVFAVRKLLQKAKDAVEVREDFSEIAVLR